MQGSEGVNHQVQNTPAPKKPCGRARQSNGGTQVSPIQRTRIIELAAQGLPVAAIAKKLNTGQKRVSEVIAAQVDFSQRLVARLRLTIPYQVQAALTEGFEREISECRQQCYEEREVA